MLRQNRKKKILVDKYKDSNTALANWIDNNIHECFTVFNTPREFWIKLRRVNTLERLNREIKRRTNIVSIFPNNDSALRLITAIAVEINDEWIIERNCYLNLKSILH